QIVKEIVENENLKQLFRNFEKTLDEIFVLRPSRKHLNAVQENVTFESSQKSCLAIKNKKVYHRVCSLREIKKKILVARVDH
ncbi:hypothetical protein DB41_AU00110, partial [Neochlamydia sp. TUME1]|uniref:hypothetical protein n=1 Tax=Neochlamydia sp. TUME1 TaxID=1478174 RepID=UPI0005809587